MKRKMANSHFYKFKKLDNDSNYRTWEYRMRSLLKLEGLLKHVTEGEPEANPGINGVDRVLNKWKEDSEKALSVINLCCEDDQLPHLRHCKNGKEAWEALAAHHHQVTLGTTTRITAKLYSCKLKVGGNMRHHLSKIFEWIHELIDAGISIDLRMQVGIVLASLNDEYASLVTALESWQEEQVTVEAIKARLIAEWEKRDEQREQKTIDSSVQQDAKDKEECALKTFNEGMKRKSRNNAGSLAGSSSRDSFVCHHCKLPGHFRRDCPELKEVHDRQESTRHATIKKESFHAW